MDKDGKSIYMQRIIVLTYNVPHIKTYDVLCRLKVCGYNNVQVLAKPFHYVKKFQPIYAHRPEGNGISTKQICEQFGYDYCEYSEKFPEISAGTKILVCGAGIIPQEIVKQNIIINAHPGYVPNVRGLDALKWAIIENEPIGVTTHVIGDEIDAGLIIERREISINKSDTFHLLARRVYEAEIAMLVEAIEKVDTATIYVSGEGYIVHKRMPQNIEHQLLESFERRKNSI